MLLAAGRHHELIVAEGGSNGTIYKAFSATEAEWRETRLVPAEELAVLDQVRHAPVIFQDYVPAALFDLRVTVVGDDMFAAAIHSQDTQYPVDFRIDMNRAKVEVWERAVAEVFGYWRAK
jgi:hypothetical protein